MDELREVFSIDKDFSEKKFEKQMAVVRGQALNLASAMRFCPSSIFTLMTRVYAVNQNIGHLFLIGSFEQAWRHIYDSKLQNMTEPVTYSKSAG